MLTSYHNHTTWSDGKATVAEQIAAARQAGLDELGISDHYVMHPGRVVDWSMPLDRLDDYVAAMEQARATAGIPFRIGIEADYFPETIEELRRRLARHAFDYVIGSVHFVDGFPLDSRAADWEALAPAERDVQWRLYWQRLRELAESGVFDFAAHLDLPKKFGFRPQADLTAAADDALAAIAAADMGIEINTAGWSLPAAEAYPSLGLLRKARALGIPLLINADAHRTDHLTHDFARARELAAAAGYTELVRYAGRRRFSVPLAP
jgi:histidinol-phosphatase (PHP family)